MDISSIRRSACFCNVAACLLAATAAQAQVVADGNMDALTVGTAPDNLIAAGAWAFPANYVAAAIAEPVARPEVYTVVPTSSFQTGATGNSLHLLNAVGTAADNFHLPNLWTQSFTAAPGLVLRVTFNFWVEAGSGGGSVYVGGDNGGGGFSNATGDRTAQLSWLADGTLNRANNAGVNIPILTYRFGEWQNVQIDIDTDARTYDLYWSMGSDPLAQVGDNLPFRAPTPALSVSYDRITYVQFGATIPAISSYLDNVAVEAVPNCAPCAADFNQDGGVDGADVEAFFAVWEAGGACGDVNADGGIDGGDVEGFFAVWEAGGCG